MITVSVIVFKQRNHHILFASKIISFKFIDSKIFKEIFEENILTAKRILIYVLLIDRRERLHCFLHKLGMLS